MLQILQRRAPGISIRVRGVRVQGPGAAQEIADAISAFSAEKTIDLLVVADLSLRFPVARLLHEFEVELDFDALVDRGLLDLIPGDFVRSELDRLGVDVDGDVCGLLVLRGLWISWCAHGYLLVSGSWRTLKEAPALAHSRKHIVDRSR